MKKLLKHHASSVPFILVGMAVIVLGVLFSANLSTKQTNSSTAAQAAGALPAPAGITHTCSGTGDRVTFRWNAVTGAANYQLRLDYHPDSWAPGTGTGKDVNDQMPGVMPGTTWTATIVPNQEYWMTIQAVRSTDVYPYPGAYGGTGRFTCSPALPPVTNLKATCAPTGDRVTFNWNAVSGAANYQLRLDHKPDTWAPGTGAGKDVNDQMPGLMPGVSWTATILPDTEYWLTVQAVRSTDIYPYPGQYASTGRFTCAKAGNTTPLPAPTNVKAACNATGNRVTFSWNAVSGAANYQVRLDHKPDTWAPGTGAGKDVNDQMPGLMPGVSWTATILPDTEYWLTVQAVRSTDAYPYPGQYGGTGRFTCSSAPTATPPGTGGPLPAVTNLKHSCDATGKKVTFTWNAVSGAANYQLRLDYQPDSWAPGTGSGKDVNDQMPGVMSARSWTATILPDSEYWLTVQAVRSTDVYPYPGLYASTGRFTCSSTGTPTNTPAATANPTNPPSTSCGCQQDFTCASSCNFQKVNDRRVTYANPIQCKLATQTSTPSKSTLDSWCKRSKRTRGDADGNGKVTARDYYYYRRVVRLKRVPNNVNADFSGDGEVGTVDAVIVLKTLKRLK